MKTRRLISRPTAAAAAALLFACFLGGCGDATRSTDEAGAGGVIKVTCTTGMVADIVRNVVGPKAEVVTLMSAGVDPHLYKATTSDVVRLDEADVVFYSGLHLEGKMADLLHRLESQKKCVALAEQIEEDRLLELEEGVFDPHIWFDVSMWSDTIAVVAATMGEVDPTGAEQYEANAEAYRGKLSELHAYCQQELAQAPEQRRVLVTAHDAFGYFGRAYGLEVKAIQGISTESEAGVKEINDLVDYIVERGVKAVFVESSVADDNIRALVEGCDALGHRVEIGGELFSDAMGESGTPEGTYEGMVRHNVKTIVGALQ